MSKKITGPVLIELDDTTVSPDAAPDVPDISEAAPQAQNLHRMVKLASARPSRLWRWFWGTLVSLLIFVVTLNTWDFVLALLERNIWAGRIALGLTTVFLACTLALILREWLAFVRLRRMDGLRKAGELARRTDDLAAARAVSDRLVRFFAGRADLQWGLRNFADQRGEVLDGDGLLDLAETEVLGPLDQLATLEIEAAARQVATITAIVPLALVDVVTALAANLRMVRRIATIYGGRAGLFGSWRLLRTVLLHLVATGAVSIGDDLIGSLAGGGVLSKISRRFGEGVINGALTARVGVAAMEVCRPLPFHRLKRPGVTGLVKRALTGLFGARK